MTIALRASKAQAWLLATRPKTLIATVVPIACGTALARADSGLTDVRLLIYSLLATFCLQIATNFVNDAMDFVRGTDTAGRLGPTRASSAGLLDPKLVLRAGVVFLALAFLLGLPLVAARGPAILAIGVLSIVASYSYTGGPFPLAYHGLGDLFVMIFFGWFATAGSYFVQTGEFSAQALVLGTQVGLLATALIAINNLRDIREDTANHKRTFAVIFGARAARVEIAAALLLPMLINLYWMPRGPWVVGLPIFLTLPTAIVIIIKVATLAPSRAYNVLLARTAFVNLLFGVGFVAGLLRG